jgi:hypothetical protein
VESALHVKRIDEMMAFYRDVLGFRLRRPVQVLAGNHEVMAGACPWFDAVKRGHRSA